MAIDRALLRSRENERFALDEARAHRRAAGGYIDRPVEPHESIGRLLGDELIDAGRATVGAYYGRDPRRLDRAVRWLAKLVGGAP